MAIAFGQTSGDYCWLFSGDDLMRPGALARALEEIESGCDVYLSKHMEYRQEPKGWTAWPVLDPDEAAVFDLADPAQRHDYFSRAVNTEAFFSFMGGMITKRSTWDRVPYNEAFDRSCWGHVARFFELMPGGLTLKFVPETWQDRRPENDSFADQGMINRFRISIEGYHRLADTFFGAGSVEAFHVRRVIRWEFNYGMFLYGKYLCWLNPGKESRALLWRLLGEVFPGYTYEDLSTRLAYATTPVWRYRRWNREFCAAHEKARDERAKA